MLKSEWIKTDKGFFVGDPCYVFEDMWSNIVSQYFEEDEKNGYDKSHTITVNGGHIGMVSTMYGDGGYLGTDGGDYSVDSGTLGIVPIEVAELDVNENSYLGRVIEYKGEARVLYEEGLVTIEFKDNNLEDIDIQTGAVVGLEEFLDNWL